MPLYASDVASDTRLEGDEELFLFFLELNQGCISAACKSMGVSRSWYSNHIKENGDFKQRVLEINAAGIDFVESKLMENIQVNNQRAIEFYLECKGKSRGWVKRREYTGADGGPQIVIHQLPQDQLDQLKEAAALAAKKEVGMAAATPVAAAPRPHAAPLPADIVDVTPVGTSDGGANGRIEE